MQNDPVSRRHKGRSFDKGGETTERWMGVVFESLKSKKLQISVQSFEFHFLLTSEFPEYAIQQRCAEEMYLTAYRRAVE